MKGWKIPSPSPTTPPIPNDFIIYILTTSKMLVECTSSVFSPPVFKCVWEDKKTENSPCKIGLRINSSLSYQLVGVKAMGMSLTLLFDIFRS